MPPTEQATLAGRTVFRVGYGAMQLERLSGDRPAAVALLRQALELGVDHLDTAQFYGNGFVNDVIREVRTGALIATKVGADPDPGAPTPLRLAQKPEELRASVEDNLRALGVDSIPLVNLRRAERLPGVLAEGDQQVDLDDQLEVMTQLRAEGKIGAIGLSAVTPETLRRALPAGIACVQNAYSLVSRDDEEMLELCLAEGIAWVPFFPLGGAFPGLPKVTDEPPVQKAAQELGRTPAQVGLAWLLHRAPNVHLIPGTASVEHLEANLAVAEIELDDETLAELGAIPTRPMDLSLR
ncbi:aldo/keto reductase [Amycolatopsis sp. Hca4]|uniref:aldo/keto reductase n=1 Tax=Amycolatopsis sp. Hca4 TaxID=2742131 RepID=UPI00159127DA|nr:aldo/keto reductase [Amycolatopsis sp. Hca4]QKV79868.1 aldo/keto reductase [Amycolatopsis sp. Hca4]